MKGDYPGFKVTYTDEELAEHFLLTPAERALVETCRGDVNRHGIAVLVKAVQYLGYFPEDLSQVPSVIRTFIAHQLQLLWDHTTAYPRHPSTRDVHVALIRQHTGFRFPLARISRRWRHGSGLTAPLTPRARRSAGMCVCSPRDLGIEVPAMHEFSRIIQAALRGFFQDIY